jgi:hypothetical protein
MGSEVNMRYLEDAKALYAPHYPEASARVKPCSDAEILALEHQFRYALPHAYREFLAWMGKDGDLWTGFDWTYQSLESINLWAQEMVTKSSRSKVWPDTAFVFFWDPGGTFKFLRTEEGDDPPVYFFMDQEFETQLRGGEFSTKGADDPVVRYLLSDTEPSRFFQLAPRFSSFLVEQIYRQIRARRRHEELREKLRRNQP